MPASEDTVAGQNPPSNTSIPSKNASDQISISKPAKESMSKAAPEKNALSRPENPTPNDGAKDQALNLVLGWSEAAPGNTVTYTVYMGTSSSSMSKEYTIIKNSLLLPIILDPATTYYWKVEANSGQNISTSDIWSFTTQNSPNSPPNKPQDPIPMDDAKDMQLNPELSWTGGDPDGDLVEYTVFMSTNFSSAPLEFKASGKSLSIPSNLSYGVKYYWKVLASDGKLDNTSETWSFTTQSKPNRPPNKPRDPNPENHAKDRPTNAVLSWNSEDPEGAPVTYRVFMGPALEKMTQIYNGPAKNCSTPTSDYGVTNFWKVEASDGKLTNSSDVWSFTTQGQPAWEQPNTINAIIGAVIAVMGGIAAKIIKGRKL
jgi:hypothetical protein